MDDLAALGKIPKKKGRAPSNSNSTPKKDGNQKITSLFNAVPKSTTPAPSPAVVTSEKAKPTSPASSPAKPAATVSTTPKKRGRPPKNTKDSETKEKDSVSSVKKKGKEKAAEKQNAKTKGNAAKKTSKKIVSDDEDLESEDDSEDSEDEFNPDNTDEEGDNDDDGDGVDGGDDDDEEDEEEVEEDSDSDAKSTRRSGRGRSRGSSASSTRSTRSTSTRDTSGTSRNKRRHEDISPNNEVEADKTIVSSNSNDSNADTDENKPALKKRGRKSKAELAELAKQGIPTKKSSHYIKKGQPGYVRPAYNYVRKTPVTKPVTSVVEEESPLFSSEFVILPEWMPSAHLIVEKDNSYLPKSQDISFKWENSKDIHLELFQVCLHDIRGTATESDKTAILGASTTSKSPLPSTGKCNSVVLNVGGPVWNIDWCPVPQDQADGEYHYMAIGSYVSDSTHALGHIYRDKNIIQIWRIGALTEDGLDLSQQLPTFCFGIAHEGEAAVCMKWCPLGGFAKAEKNTENVLDRLGLLAVSFFDGSFKVYSVPHPNAIEKQNKGHPLVLRLTPVFEHNPPTQQLTQQLGSRIEEIECGACTRDLSWSIDNDWALLLAGDDEGTLSVWNLSKFASLPSTTNSVALPILSLNAHRRRITSVAWSPLCKHQFLSCGQDGFLKFWDLRDPFHPLFTYLTGGAWLQCLEYPTTKLPFLLFGMDDYSVRFMDLKEVVTTVNKWHFGPIWGVSTNLYNCTLATCSSDGSIKSCNLNEKSAKKRKAQIVTKLIEQQYFNPETNLITFSSTPATPTIIPAAIPASNGDKSTPKKPSKKKKQEDEEDDSDEEGTKKQKKKKKDVPQKEEEEKETGIYVFPHEKLQINQVKWNPRARSNSWLAFCGNTGLVCIKLVKCKENE